MRLPYCLMEDAGVPFLSYYGPAFLKTWLLISFLNFGPFPLFVCFWVVFWALQASRGFRELRKKLRARRPCLFRTFFPLLHHSSTELRNPSPWKHFTVVHGVLWFFDSDFLYSSIAHPEMDLQIKQLRKHLHCQLKSEDNQLNCFSIISEEFWRSTFHGEFRRRTQVCRQCTHRSEKSQIESLQASCIAA